MYRFWEPVIEPLLERIQPKVIVEIGSDHGHNTRNLLEFSRRTRSTLHVIDPLPKYEVGEWQEQYQETLFVHLQPSLEVLESIESPDAVLIDGDHNWHTVFHELKALDKTSGDAFPLVLLHDVGWPYARRDLYYEPDRIPAPHRQPYRKQGMRPGSMRLDPRGGLNSHLFNAVEEGGPRNGVLTAVEDFMAESESELEFVLVPGINDLGILFQSDLGSRHPSAASFLDELQAPVLRQMLARVERLRVEAQIAHADTQRDLMETRTTLNDAHKALALAQSDRDASAAAVRALKAELETNTSALRNQLSQTEARVAQSKSDLEGLAVLANQLRSQVEAANAQYDALRSRRSVRLALGLARVASPVFSLARGREPDQTPAQEDFVEEVVGYQAEATELGPDDEEALRVEIMRGRPGSRRTDGPLVSIIVLTRNGAAHISALLDRLKESVYRSFEVIVVDNASTDETPEILKASRSYPLSVITNEWNVSFSAGNRQGVETATGDLLLFMNNDIDPINPGWLGAMVDAVESDESVVAAGAVLVYPVRQKPGTDLTVQHRGIDLGFKRHSVHAFNVAAANPLDDQLAGIVNVPAATAATLMVRRDAFEEVGGFNEGYVYGCEDVDLCLKLSEVGRIVVTGQAVLFHNESATQSAIGSEISTINHISNWQRFAETWAPRATRSILRDRLSGSHRWTRDDERTVAITLTHDDPSQGWGDYYTAHELGSAFAGAGWRVIYPERHGDRWYEIDDEVDLWVSLLDSFDVTKAPSGAVTIAWVRNWVDRWLDHPWFESYDLVVASSHKAASLLSARSRFDVPVVPLATNTDVFEPRPPNPTFESDYAFTGNNWGPGRKLTSILDVEPGERFLLFGLGWDKDQSMSRYWRGHLRYDLLPELYSSTKIVLDDTASPTLPYAFLNGRVFDALAAGALVLSDNVEGSLEMFDGKLPTYTSEIDLRRQLDHYLANEEERLSLVGELRERVASFHSYSTRPDDLLRVAIDNLERTQAAIKVDGLDGLTLGSSDGAMALALAGSLTRIGIPTVVHIQPEWDLPRNLAQDMVIHLRGTRAYVPKRAHLNVLWIVSHHDDLSPQEADRYDLVLVASQGFADSLRPRVSVPVVFMPLAADERHFHTVESRPELAPDVLYVGDRHAQSAPVVASAAEEGFSMGIYGRGWSDQAWNGLTIAEDVPADELAALYASSRVVLTSHDAESRKLGFVSHRVFDVLGSGGVIVSDEVAGLDELFGDLVPTYDGPDRLRESMQMLFEDDARRKEISNSATSLVATEHTFAQRATTIEGLVAPLLAKRPKDLEGESFGPLRRRGA
jgi:O-antigen biosynthesis protein